MKRKSGGFTLVEVLVAISIVAVIGAILVGIFANTLRGGNKSQILANIKQNGQAVLENMDKTIRGADNVVCRDNTGDTLVIVKNGSYTRFKFINNSIKQDLPEMPAGGERNAFEATLCTELLGTDASTLTDTNLQTGVKVENVPNGLGTKPIFDRSAQAGSKDSVTVQFQLKPAAGAPPVIAGQIDPVIFQTTVQLR